MPNPKRRHSIHRQGIRRSHLARRPPQVNHCARCGAAIRSHRVCDTCGYYGFAKENDMKGVEVVRKEDF
ncbi:MAG: 50S ribosomal protein L32 [Planctomycetota bacterium]